MADDNATENTEEKVMELFATFLASLGLKCLREDFHKTLADESRSVGPQIITRAWLLFVQSLDEKLGKQMQKLLPDLNSAEWKSASKDRPLHWTARVIQAYFQ